jgi:hypothetical protein
MVMVMDFTVHLVQCTSIIGCLLQLTSFFLKMVMLIWVLVLPMGQDLPYHGSAYCVNDCWPVHNSLIKGLWILLTHVTMSSGHRMWKARWKAIVAPIEKAGPDPG